MPDVAVPPDGDVPAALKVWRDSLINLTGTNRALNFKHSKSGSVEIDGPSLDEIIDGLRANVMWTLIGERADDEVMLTMLPAPRQQSDRQHVLHCRKSEKDLGATLRNLARRAKAEYLDRGLSVMYLGLGSLRWMDVDETPYISPLVLVPVEFIMAGAKEAPRLKASDDDPVANPALALRLTDFGVTLPGVDDIKDLALQDWLEGIRELIADHSGWTVTDDVVLSAFSFQKEAMYRDLLANEGAIASHPLVRALANQDPTRQDGCLLFEPDLPEDIDRVAPPEDTPLVLDADSSQRACIAAAVAGRSFVMDGPPGTGKSQTIANMIGALLYAGKSVLFVSEKAAALEVVRNRLEEVGLVNYVLELHSHKASRKEVAHQLAQALDTVPIPPPGMDGQDRRQVRDLRRRLSAYADAMNRPREPLGYTLHQALGEATTLERLPAPPSPSEPPTDLTRETLAEIGDAAARLARAWRPAVQGRSYLWRDVTQRGSLDGRLDLARTTLEELAGVTGQHQVLTRAYGLTSINDVVTLVLLVEHAAERPPGVTSEWLTRDVLGDVADACDELRVLLDGIAATSGRVVAEAGVPWRTLPDPATLPTIPDLRGMAPAFGDLGDLTAVAASEIAGRFEADASMLAQRYAELNGITTTLGLPPVVAAADATAVLDLAEIVCSPHRPARAWFNLGVLPHVQTAAQVLRAMVTELGTAEAVARRSFTAAALRHPLPELQSQLGDIPAKLVHLSGSYHRNSGEGAWCSAGGLAEVRTAAETLRLRADQLRSAEVAAVRTFTAAAIAASPRELRDRLVPINEVLRGQNAAQDEPAASHWCTPEGIFRVQGAARTLRIRSEELHAAETAARGTFTEAVLRTPLAAVAEYFAPAQPVLHRLSGARREHPFVVAWSSGAGIEQLRNSTQVLRGLMHELDAAEASARCTFTDAILGTSPADLRDYFAQVQLGPRPLSTSSEATAPDSLWCSADGVDHLRTTAQDLRSLVDTLAVAEAAGRHTFTEVACAYPVAEVRDFFASVRSTLHRLSGSQRLDRFGMAWCTADGLERVRASANILRVRLEAVRIAEAAARPMFTDAALTEPVAELHDRFTNGHKGLKKLSSTYRQDTKVLTDIKREAVSVEEAVQGLGLAVEWAQSAVALETAVAEHAPYLGTRWRGLSTDFALVEEAIEVAEQIGRLAPDSVLPAVLIHGIATDPLSALQKLKVVLDIKTEPASLMDALVGLDLAVEWNRAHAALDAAVDQAPDLGDLWRGRETDFVRLEQAFDVAAEIARLAPNTLLPALIIHGSGGDLNAALTRLKVLAEAKNEAATLVDAINDLALAVAWTEAVAALDAAVADRAPYLGDLWCGRSTDFSTLDRILDLAEEIYRLAPDSVLPAVLAHATEGDPHRAVSGLETLARVKTPSASLEDAVREVGQAVAWADTAAALEAAVQEHAGCLGRHWHGRSTDFAELEETIEIAEKIVLLEPGSSLAPLSVGSEEIDSLAVLEGLRALVQIKNEEVSLNDAIGDLDLAVAWADAAAALDEAVVALSPLLGGFWRGKETDHAAVSHAVEVAERLVELAPDSVLPAVIVHATTADDPGMYLPALETLAGIKNEAASMEDALADLKMAVAWAEGLAALDAAVAEHAGYLGDHWRGRSTDFDNLDSAIEVAQQVIQRSPGSAVPAVIEHATLPVPDTAMHGLTEQIRNDLDDWRSRLAPAPTPAARPELNVKSLEYALQWLGSHAEALHGVEARAGAVGRAIRRATTLREAEALLTLRQHAVSAESVLDAASDRLRDVVGTDKYRGQTTDVDGLEAQLRWTLQLRAHPDGADGALTQEQAEALIAARPVGGLAATHRRWTSAAQTIVDAFAPTRHLELWAEFETFDAARGLLDDLLEDSSGQDEWFSYQRARNDLQVHHLDDVVEHCIEHGVPATELVQTVRQSVLRAWAEHILAEDEDLNPKRAADRDALIAEFRHLDRQLILAGAGEIIRRVNAGRPSAVDVEEPALIRREGMKKTRHMPVRDLIRKTRDTTLAIKPCFMMSPLAVSQYLPADIRFDTVIFDEASQVSPGDAINCIYRGKAFIAAGDNKQLPPTSFFDRMVDPDEDIASEVQDYQSILELAKASGGYRNLGLKWHYRSRHESLIAFSNHRFYDSRLITYPGAHSEGPDVGLEMFKVEGRYRGGTAHRNNPIEAEAVVERIVHHFDTRPGLSLGVVTFSLSQADAIQGALDRAMDVRPDLRRHLEGDRLHGLFIKSLESVQGDERDVMIFSIGYGPDENGKISTNFGVYNRPMGWRRLNVAITRARLRVEIVTSMRSAEIPSTENESINALRSYLDFAERGMPALALQLGPSGLGTESPFEDSVLDVIRSMGYEVEPQVGTAGYRIDLGVKHPAYPGVFALGVECDGYAYHSSPVARDRDRLRDQVLTGLGWRLHRIWGTAWYRNRAQEIERLDLAIKAAIAAPIGGILTGPRRDAKRALPDIEPVVVPEVPAWTTPYQMAQVDPLPRWTEVSEPGARWEMVTGITALAEQEGPVHIDLVIQRLKAAWNIGRISPAIRDNIDGAIALVDVTYADGFLDRAGRTTPVPVRVPVNDVGKRTAIQVPEAELRSAITNLLQDAGGASEDELTAAVARIFGWNRRGPEIATRLAGVLSRLHVEGAICADGDALRLA